MWDKLLSLFKEQPLVEEIRPVVQRVERVADSPAPTVKKMDGPSTNIGFNYLKGMDDEENNPSRSRRFINLNRLLRGDYDGKIAGSDEEPQKDIRRTDT